MTRIFLSLQGRADEVGKDEAIRHTVSKQKQTLSLRGDPP
jgi:hypothetical protein